MHSKKKERKSLWTHHIRKSRNLHPLKSYTYICKNSSRLTARAWFTWLNVIWTMTPKWFTWFAWFTSQAHCSLFGYRSTIRQKWHRSSTEQRSYRSLSLQQTQNTEALTFFAWCSLIRCMILHFTWQETQKMGQQKYTGHGATGVIFRSVSHLHLIEKMETKHSK